MLAPRQRARQRTQRRSSQPPSETLCAMLNAGVHPVIPSQGSVGASGDLAPLAHLAQVVIGEGQRGISGRNSLRRRSSAARKNCSRRARRQRRPFAPERHARHAGAAQPGAASRGCARRHRRCCRRAFSRRSSRQPRRIRLAHHARARLSRRRAAPPAISRISTKAAKSANRIARPKKTLACRTLTACAALRKSTAPCAIPFRKRAKWRKSNSTAPPTIRWSS